MALVEGIKYGLSSYQNQSHNHPSSPIPPVSSNKSVLFVKLTDSAIRSIEEYLKTQHKTGQNATLQFLGNEGRINIPSSHSSQGQAFDFSLQSNADIEGPQGSFECIQQSSSRSLESMGTLPFKMRIKANDDVYAETRQRFIEAEAIRKEEFCAKEIKPGGPDIGRKVKKKPTDRLLPPLGRREPSPFNNSKCSPNNSFSGGKSTNGYGYNSTSSNKNFGGFNPGGNSSNNPSSRSSTGGPGAGPANIAKRPLKERLIHLLALKSFKKPELHIRLNRDGLKNGEKPLVMTILRQISTFKDNEYVLLRGVWNDVQEDWPCYTEQERQLIQRRKPQNLTPPGSDCSVSSGVSGCSLSPRSSASTSSGNSSPSHHSNSHFGTKSTVVNKYNMNPHGPGVKRPASTDPIVGPDGILLEDIRGYGDVPNSKKPRVSHFKRPVRSSGGSVPNGNLSYASNMQNGSGANLLTPNFRSDRDGLSPGLHQNRIAERLSPIGSITGNASGSNHLNVGLAHSMTNHRSPSNMGEQASSPSYFNGSVSNQLSPQGTFHAGDDNMGGYSPYSWNSKVNSHDPQGYLDTNKSQGADSDETDSIDSGNGSSGSSSGSHRHYNHSDQPSYNGTNSYQKGSLANSKSSKGPEHTGSNSANLLTSASCNRVSSTTNGSGSGYHTTPHSSPENHLEALQLSQQQKNGCEGTVKQSSGPGYFTVGGSVDTMDSNHGSSSLMPKHKVGHSDRRGDKERTSGRDRESRGRDRSDRNERDRRNREDRKSAPKSNELETRKDNDEGDNASSNKPAHYPPYLTGYTTIESSEQRSRYKDEFNSDYPLYRDLHAVIEKVSRKFAQLQERLRQEEEGSEEYQSVRDQIVKEYYASKKDKKYQESKDKFNFLHKKLLHIKELVAAYDRHAIGHGSSPVR